MSSVNNHFYVYIHRKETNGDIFYVGKGKGGRWMSHHSRNQHWNNIVKKHGLKSEIVMWFEDECKAYEFEKSLISIIGRENLCNATNGGEGGPGAKGGELHPLYGKKGKESPRWGKKHSEADRIAISNGRKNGKEPFYSEDARRRMAKKWTVIEKKKLSNMMSGEGNPSYRKEQYIFVNEDGREFLGTMHFFCKEFNLSKGNVCWMIKGKLKSVKGWTVKDSIKSNMEVDKV